ncbi:MAG: hypothetical protein AAF567_24250 [Actinomycetota bacterium]
MLALSCGDTTQSVSGGGIDVIWAEQLQLAATTALVEVRVEEVGRSGIGGIDTTAVTVQSVEWLADAQSTLGGYTSAQLMSGPAEIRLDFLSDDNVQPGDVLLVGIHSVTQIEPGSDGFAPLVFVNNGEETLGADWQGTITAVRQAQELRAGVPIIDVLIELLEDGQRWLGDESVTTSAMAPDGLLSQIGITGSAR